MTRTATNLLTGATVAVVIAGAMYVATLTSIALWRYLLAVAGVALFVFGGLSRRAG